MPFLAHFGLGDCTYEGIARVVPLLKVGGDSQLAATTMAGNLAGNNYLNLKLFFSQWSVRHCFCYKILSTMLSTRSPPTLEIWRDKTSRRGESSQVFWVDLKSGWLAVTQTSTNLNRAEPTRKRKNPKNLFLLVLRISSYLCIFWNKKGILPAGSSMVSGPESFWFHTFQIAFWKIEV